MLNYLIIIAVFMFYRIQRFGFPGRRLILSRREGRSFVLNMSENRYNYSVNKELLNI